MAWDRQPRTLNFQPAFRSTSSWFGTLAKRQRLYKEAKLETAKAYIT